MFRRKWHDQTQLIGLLNQYDFEVDDYQSLLEIQSLTQGLEKLNPNFSVELLNLAEILAPNYPNILPELKQRPNYFSRQVILKLDEQPVIWAESLCDVDSQFWCEYLNCGTQSLGRKLFDGHNEITRTNFVYRAFEMYELPFILPEKICVQHVIARQSIFTYHHEDLCLTEWYLPNLSQFMPK